MKKLASIILPFLLGMSIMALGAIVFDTHAAHAECTVDKNSDQYCLLEPLPLGGGAVYDKYDPKLTSAADYINTIIKVFISIIGVLGVIMIVLGGVQYMTTDAISKKEGGREMITNSVFGLLLALASWLILYTINPHLTEIRIDPPSGLKFEVESNADLPAAETLKTATVNGLSVTVKSSCSQTSVNEAAKDGVAMSTGVAWASEPKIAANETETRKKLHDLKIEVNKSNCAKVGDNNCTSVYKLGQSTIDNLAKLRNDVCKSDANCTLTITGASECWLHESHEIGSGRVDISSADGKLDAYLNQTTKTCIPWLQGPGCPSGQAPQYIQGTRQLIRENDHFHVHKW